MLDKRVVDYTVLRAGDLSNLRCEITSYIKKGREPFGSIRAVTDSQGVVYSFYQPIVKYKYLYINPEECEKITGSISKQPGSINDTSEKNASESDCIGKE